MARNIVQYNREIIPGGSSGEVMTPYKDAPPLMPINVAAPQTAALVGLGKSIENAAEDYARIEQYNKQKNEESLATIALMQFKNQGLQTVGEALKVMGPNAVATEEQPGLTAKYLESRTQQANELIDAQAWSPSVKAAATRALMASVHEEASQVKSHENAQNVFVNNQAIAAVVSDAEQTMRAFPLDDYKAATAMSGVLSVLNTLAPGNVDKVNAAHTLLIDARLDGLIQADPDKAAAYLAENKLFVGDKYDAQRKRVTIAQVERDALISPGVALEKLGAMENGQPKFYRELTSTERVAAVSSVIAQVEGRERLDNMRRTQQDRDTAYGYYDIINKGMDPRKPDAAISSGQREMAGVAYLNDLVSQRKISTNLYEHLLNSSKQGVTTDFNTFQKLKINVELGRASVAQITGAEGIGAGDKAALLDKKRVIDNANEQLSIMRRQELNTVRSMAQTLMLPHGYAPSQDQVNSFLTFNNDLNAAVKKGADPTQYYMENGWRYLKSSIPTTIYGSPTNLQNADEMGDRLTKEHKSGKITNHIYNIESEKIMQAKRIFAEQAEQTAKSTEKRKTR